MVDLGPVALPTGELTFCFTDVEGSTVLLRRLGERYDAVIADHHRLLRESMAASGGTVVRTDGDAFFVVFQRATDAVAACADAQRVVADHPWPDGVALRVRMGLHTGEARLNTEGEYVGIAIHQAARISSAANGAQVLMSATTAAMAELPPSATSFRPVGSFRLKDFDEPVALVELAQPGSSPAPPRALPAAGHNLALRRTSFIGRWEELQLLGKLADACAVVTLVGPGGVGKTRLAVEFGGANASSFPDGVWFVDLSEADGDASLLGAVANAVGAHIGAGTDPSDAVLNAIGSRELLLVVDNCEHVLAPAAALIEDIVAVCPAVTVLATSRQRLEVPGERVLRLGPLGVAPEGTPAHDLGAFESARLFLDRAGLAAPASAEDAAAVVSICTSLDGLPLGIELAAARAPTLGLRTVASHLTEVVLQPGAGPEEPSARRQRTLRSTIRWSHELLSEDERCALERLSVFHGGFTMAASMSVLAHPPLEGGAVATLVASLVEQSLVEQDAEAGRFRLLGPVHAFASERFEQASTAAAVRDRHAAHFAGMARLDEDFDVLAPDGWVAPRQVDEANFLAALRHDPHDADERLALVVTVALLARAQGRWREGYDLVTDGLRRAEPGPVSPHLFGLACLVAADMGRRCGFFGDARERCGTAIDLAERAGDRSLAMNAHAGAAAAARVQGDRPAEGAHTERARELARELGGIHARRLDGFLGGRRASPEDAERAAAADLVSRAWRALRSGAHEVTRSLVGEAIAEGRRLGHRGIEARAQWALAELHDREGRPDEARAVLAETVELGLAAGPTGLGIALESYGKLMQLELARHDARAAREARSRVSELDVGRDGPEKLIHEHRVSGHLALVEGDPAGALEEFEQSLDLVRASGYREMEVRLLLLIGNAHVARGELSAAERAYEEAQAVATSLDRPDPVAVAAYNLALVDHRRSGEEKARSRLEDLVARESELPAWLSDLAAAELGALLRERGETDRAAGLLAAARANAEARRDQRCVDLCDGRAARFDAPVVER